jgi:hypothetical protein
MDEVFTKTLILFMNIAQKSEDFLLNGSSKKEFVLTKVKLFLGPESYERYSPMVSAMIDLLKAISKDKKILDGLKMDRLPCFKF